MLNSRRNLKRNLKLRCKKVCKNFDDSGKISTFKYIIWDGIKDRETFTFFPVLNELQHLFWEVTIKIFKRKRLSGANTFLSLFFRPSNFHIEVWIYFDSYCYSLDYYASGQYIRVSLEFLFGWGFWNVKRATTTEM